MRYVDTSVLIAYLTRESSSAVAEAFVLSQGEPFAVSTWTEVELLSALGNKLRSRRITASLAKSVIKEYNHSISPQLHRIAVTDADHVYAASLLSGWRSALRAGDSLHLAIATTRGASVYTLDRGMTTAGHIIGLPVVLLG